MSKNFSARYYPKPKKGFKKARESYLILSEEERK